MAAKPYPDPGYNYTKDPDVVSAVAELYDKDFSSKEIAAQLSDRFKLNFTAKRVEHLKAVNGLTYRHPRSPFFEEPRGFFKYMAMWVADGHTVPEIREKIWEKYGLDLTKSQIEYYKYRNALPSGPLSRHKTVYPEGFDEFIRSFTPGHYAAEIAEEANRRFGTSFTESQIQNYKDRRRITSGLSAKSKPLPDGFHEFMLEFTPGHSLMEIVKEAESRFDIEINKIRVKNYKQKYGIHSGMLSEDRKK